MIKLRNYKKRYEALKRHFNLANKETYQYDRIIHKYNNLTYDFENELAQIRECRKEHSNIYFKIIKL